MTGSRLKPDSADARNNLGNALVRKGYWDEAIVEFREALKLKPDSSDIHNSLGVVLSWKRRWDEASIEFQEALRLQPDYAEARENLEFAVKMKEPNATTNSAATNQQH
jgi:Flp pilus assembly protein TadD